MTRLNITRFLLIISLLLLISSQGMNTSTQIHYSNCWRWIVMRMQHFDLFDTNVTNYFVIMYCFHLSCAEVSINSKFYIVRTSSLRIFAK